MIARNPGAIRGRDTFVVAEDKVELDAAVELELDELDMCRVLLTCVSMLLTLEAELSSIVEDSDQRCWASIFLKLSTWIWSGVRIRTPRYLLSTGATRPTLLGNDQNVDILIVRLIHAWLSRCGRITFNAVLMSANSDMNPELPEGSDDAWIPTRAWQISDKLRGLLENPALVHEYADHSGGVSEFHAVHPAGSTRYWRS